jgi:DNA integrity scanning protein DisA with diadenylate cyclase activity
MKITKTRYENAKKKLKEMEQYRKVITQWETALKDCEFKDHVTAITSNNGTVRFEVEQQTA